MIQSIKFAVTAGLYAVVCMSFGCDDGPRNAPRMSEADRLAADRYPQVVSGEGLDDVVGVQYARIVVTMPEPAAGKVLDVSVPVRCLTGKDIRVQYKFSFLDKAGREIRPESGWKYQVLPPRVERFLTANALDTSAVDWRLEIQSAK